MRRKETATPNPPRHPRSCSRLTRAEKAAQHAKQFFHEKTPSRDQTKGGRDGRFGAAEIKTGYQKAD
jgi:hypothetical protein